MTTSVQKAFCIKLFDGSKRYKSSKDHTPSVYMYNKSTHFTTYSSIVQAVWRHRLKVNVFCAISDWKVN